MRGLYIHIPFCKSICNYCDFPKLVTVNQDYDAYIRDLIQELQKKREYLDDIQTVYIGGGTPNHLPIPALKMLFSSIKPYLDVSKESTIECNPELITKEFVELLAQYKFNRVSLGVQTIDSKVLQILGRHHTKEDVFRAVTLLKEYGITNISCDFIFGAPGATLSSLKQDIEFLSELNIPHCSFYSLILEEKTVFSYWLENKKITLPEDDLVADMYDWLNHELPKLGYKHYEVSNYAKLGYESIHNELYWKCQEYVGIGMGAAEYIVPYRNTNYRTLKKYHEFGREESIYISKEDEKKEFMMLGLRMLNGISILEYQKKFGTTPQQDFSLEDLFERGLLREESNRIYIPEDHLFIANMVYIEFID